ncbi:MAG TPA: hypothetical protein PL107_09190 [Candidatus Marinimicrobia bacterium]|jgi:sialate O-acetylesterase|nr:hypothetical protein [Candidatus Neomarinimicrobiota bacterium]HPB00620.1 hypothetical protein [Candidatus Neomarinimicrobiota bacterium]HQQ85534.1 hypothetical protein [Candidatus Neomarinimicrobiota bacterium]HRD19140.1 hypothetical protein [Candidatus Neomarinimicrobiota bacterium]
MAVAIGNQVPKGIDIRPNHQQGIERQLAILALNHMDGIDTDSFDPQYTKIQTTDYRIEVYFGCANDGLRTTAPQRLKWFEISGKNLIFFQMDADIEKHSVCCQNQNVDCPEVVRYTWADNPECHLLNGFGLPDSHFRTECWHELTGRGK